MKNFSESAAYKAMSAEDKAKYAAITDESEKGAFEFMATVKHEVAEQIKGKAASTEIEALKTQIANIKPGEDLTEIKNTLKTLGLDVNALKENARVIGGPEKGSIAETLAKHKDKIEAFKSSKTGSLIIEHKATEAASDIDGRDNYFTWHQGGAVGQIPVRRPFMKELFTNVATGTEYIKYIDQETVVRDAKNVAGCGTTTHNTKLTWKTRTVQIQKVRDFVDICLDMMNDYSFVQGEITRLLDTSLALKVDNNLLLGDGSSPNMNGIDSIASTFSASSSGADYAGLVPYANIIDLVSVAGAQIKAFGQNSFWMPNVVLMNPKDVQLMKLLKDLNKNYLEAPNLTIGPSLYVNNTGTVYIDGMVVVENPLVPENEFYIGDFRRGTYYNMPGLQIEFSYENRSNFETETVTVKVYERGNLLVRNVDANAFMHCDDIQAGIAAISSGS